MPSASRTPLVGRAGELARLRSLVGLDADRPAAGAVLLAGDAGVGKTRLLTELCGQAGEQGWTVLVGHCLDLGDSALPYLPMTEAFGRLAADDPAGTADLVRAAPAVSGLLSGRSLGAAAEDTEARAGGLDRGELFQAVHTALDRLATRAPVLLVVEDVHWADESTRDLLSFLFTRSTPGPVVVLASYRSDDLHRRHPLRTTAAGWARLSTVSRQALRPLPEPDVRALIEALHPAPLPETQLRGIVSRAEGNAFFTEELVAAAELGTGHLPTDLADLLLVRLDQLDDPARAVVRAVAVAGRRVAHDLLARVVDLPGASLDDAVRQAVDGNVLVPVGHDEYGFRHALLAEAVYDDLLPGERVRLHAAYCRVLSASDEPGGAAELARHARAAHDRATATRASMRAGDEAMALAAPTEAARHYETALELIGDTAPGAPGANGGPDGDVDQIKLVMRATDALAAAGDVSRAVALARDTLDALDAASAPESRARLLLALARVAQFDEVDLDVPALTLEAMGLVPADPPSPLRARIVNMHARATADLRRDDEAMRWAQEALDLGRTLGLPEVSVDASTTVARLEERAGDPEAARAALEDTAAAARESGQVAVELRSLYHLGGLHFERGRLAEAIEVFHRATHRADETGRCWAPYGLDARVVGGVVRYVAGDWDAATDTLHVRDEAVPPVARAVLRSAALAVAAGRGDASAVDAWPELRELWDRDGMIAVFAGGPVIDLHGDRGDLAAARAVHDEVVAHISRLWQQPWFQARIRYSALLLGQVATEATRTGAADHAELASAADGLLVAAESTAAKGRTPGSARGPEGEAWLSRVAAEHARVRWLTGLDPPTADELVGAWQDTVAAFERFGHVFETARSRARLAAALRAVGRAEEADQQAAEAYERAAALGARPLLAELGPTRASGAAGVPASRRGESLTPREHEVLAQVAAGRSNGEIGRLLFISTKTVSVHVSNILAKLSASGRTEAVAIARRRGLLGDQAPAGTDTAARP